MDYLAWPSDIIFLILAVVLVVAVISGRDLMKRAVIAYVICLPTVDLPGVALSSGRVIALLTITLVLMTWACFRDLAGLRDAIRRAPGPLALVIAFVGWCAVSTAMAPAGSAAWENFFRLLAAAGILALFGRLSARLDILAGAARVFVVVMGFISAMAVVQFFWGRFFWDIGRTVEADYDYFIQVGHGLVRASGTFEDPNNLGLFCAVALMLLAAAGLKGGAPGWMRPKWALPLAVLSACGLVASLTRSAVGILIAGVAVFPFRRLIRAGALLVLALMIAATSFMRAPDPDQPLAMKPNVLGARPTYWQAGLMMAAEHPWVGVGLGNFDRALRKLNLELDAKTATLAHHRPHSIFIGLLAETGIPGLLLFLCLVFSAVRSLWRHASLADRLCLSLLLMVLIHAAMHNVLFQNIFWAILGAAFAVGRRPARPEAAATGDA